ncbi:MAG: ABC-type ribose transporter, permease protein [Pseudobdellovibrio sp.]|nr:ABC-type ribose transporter, permease protein [Pseudobdellovibrio sp.]
MISSLNSKKLAPWLGLIAGLVLCCLLALFFNESPWHVFKILTTSFYNSKFDLGLTLFYTTCLIFSGLAFAVPMKAGLFHIGSEGQILFSALIAAYLGTAIVPFDNSFSFVVSVAIILISSMAAGAASAILIAFFKILKQAHEVVVAIMLNFIFAAVTTWLTVNRLQSPTSQNPETALMNESFQFLKNDYLKTYFENSPVSVFLFAALGCCVLLHYVERRTFIGYKIRAYGANPHAATRLGFSQNEILMMSLGLAGVFSAGVGLTEVFGNAFQYKIGFSPQYGFLGIAVSLLAQQNFLGIIGSAFLMACLHKGASDLDLETERLTRDFSRVLQAIIIFSVAASYYIANLKRKK